MRKQIQLQGERNRKETEKRGEASEPHSQVVNH